VILFAAIIIREILRVGLEILEQSFRSLPTISTLRSISFRLPAIVTSSTEKESPIVDPETACSPGIVPGYQIDPESHEFGNEKS
jgi:hypothetical protein